MCPFLTHLLALLAFDPEWATNGLQEKAVDLFTKWVESQQVKGLKMEVRTDFCPFSQLAVRGPGADQIYNILHW